MALILQTMFKDSDEEIDLVTVKDEESGGILVNFDALITESLSYEKDCDDHTDSDSDSDESSFNYIDILREALLTKISLKRKREDLDADGNTAEVYSKRNKTNKQIIQSTNLIHVTKLNHSISESNQESATLEKRGTRCSPVSSTESPRNEKAIRSFIWFHCPKCDANKIFDSADAQKNDLECVNCVVKMCKGQVNINQDKLKCILLTCMNCDKKTEATNVHLDSVKCPKCMSNFALSCRNCSKQLTDLLETFYHVNKNCQFDFYNCDHCDYKYIHKIDLESHIRENHTSVVCPICCSIHKHSRGMMRHKKNCNKPANLLCHFCCYSTKHYNSIKAHLVRKHAEKFKTTAEFQAVYKKILKNGRSTTRPIPPPQNANDNYDVLTKCSYYCLQCKEIVTAVGKYNDKHCLLCNSTIIYQCNNCGARKNNYNKFYLHLINNCYPKA